MCSSTSIFMTINSLQSALIVLISCKTRRSLRSTLNYVTQSLPDYIASFLLVYIYLPIIVSFAISTGFVVTGEDTYAVLLCCTSVSFSIYLFVGNESVEDYKRIDEKSCIKSNTVFPISNNAT